MSTRRLEKSEEAEGPRHLALLKKSEIGSPLLEKNDSAVKEWGLELASLGSSPGPASL